MEGLFLVVVYRISEHDLDETGENINQSLIILSEKSVIQFIYGLQDTDDIGVFCLVDGNSQYRLCPVIIFLVDLLIKPLRVKYDKYQ